MKNTLHFLLSHVACVSALVLPVQAVTITSDPQPASVLAGDHVVFSAQATGTGTLTYQWMKDGEVIPGETRQGLVINPVTAADVASYSVAVSDAEPSTVTSAAAALTLRTPVAGDLDFSFLGGTVPVGPIYNMVTQSDGRIIVVGSFKNIGGAIRNAVARLNADGTADHSFGYGQSGASVSDLQAAHVYSVALQNDGKILIGGIFSMVNGVARSGIARLNSDGTLDTGFANGLTGDRIIRAIAVQGDGKILIGGFFQTIYGAARGSIARLNSDGTLDTQGDWLEAKQTLLS
jgi:uncharacterized delta-60 repeat protein